MAGTVTFLTQRGVAHQTAARRPPRPPAKIVEPPVEATLGLPRHRAAARESRRREVAAGGADIGSRVGLGHDAIRCCRVSQGRSSLPRRTDTGGALAPLLCRHAAHPGSASGARVGCGMEFMGHVPRYLASLNGKRAMRCEFVAGMNRSVSRRSRRPAAGEPPSRHKRHE